MDVQKFEKIKKNLEQAKQYKARSEGALDKLMGSLAKEFGVSSIDQAKAKIEEYDHSIKRDQKRLDQLMGELEKMVGAEEE